MGRRSHFTPAQKRDAVLGVLTKRKMAGRRCSRRSSPRPSRRSVAWRWRTISWEKMATKASPVPAYLRRYLSEAE